MPEDAPAEMYFAAPLLRRQHGMWFHYIPLPDDIADALQEAGVRRVIAILNGKPIRRAVQRRREGEWYLVVNKGFMREIGARLGDTVTVTLQPDPEPDRIDLGEELEAVLEQDEEAAARFHGMTPGRQRSIAYYVTSAKRVETRVKRALEMAHKLRTRTLYGDQQHNAE